MSEKKNICVFASGEGTTSQAIFDYYKFNSKIQPVLVVTNNEKAGIVRRAKVNKYPVLVLEKGQITDAEYLINKMRNAKIDLIVLAGYLKKIPKELIEEFNIINIHPSLLPKYGGKGMYGSNVHKAVLENNEKYSGFTIHKVNEEYDQGTIIQQLAIPIDKIQTVEELQNKVQELERFYYPLVIEKYLLSEA